AYSHDELLEPACMKYPEAVVLAKNAGEISEILKLANRENIPVIPRGAGTGLTSASVACFGGIVLSLEKMDKIIEIDSSNMFMTAEAGVRTAEIQRAAREHGMLYAGDPCSGESSFIGGNAATNAGGNKAVKYGTTRRQIYGLEIVTATGEILNIGGKCMKDSTGYSLLNLIIGSEGTLAVITKVCLKLMPLPPNSIDLLIVFDDFQKAIGTVPEIIKLGVNPTCVEFMDNTVVKNCEKFLKEKLPHSENGHYIIVKIEGPGMEALEEDSVKIDELCSKRGSLETLVADPARIWKARNAFAEADRAESPVFSAEDLVVPPAMIPEAVKYISELAAKYGLVVHCAGHAADGNVHAHILKGALAEGDWREKLNSLQKELYATVYSMGGKLSGEHGIGYKRVELMSQFCPEHELNMMKSIKQALDPNLILNPGKIFKI
ncbi:MAG TPA: FAD-linked oxidase C-terminal domain-containing protein, partial [Candidatus Wallbacteria bacterium]|nr:FAD-linked oxidase C-terminal domain-containing protein [Candidatus Wallbacteria bacterium]